eukprot:Skav213816  [mRNA]  locus=scaffold1987:502873:503346:+ [translate_table: standard]
MLGRSFYLRHGYHLVRVHPFRCSALGCGPVSFVSDCPLTVDALLTRRFAILIEDMELPALTPCSPQTDAGGYLVSYCQAKSEATGWFTRKPSVNLPLAFFGPPLFEGAACQCCRGQLKSLHLCQRDSGNHAVWQRKFARLPTRVSAGAVFQKVLSYP